MRLDFLIPRDFSGYNSLQFDLYVPQPVSEFVVKLESTRDKHQMYFNEIPMGWSHQSVKIAEGSSKLEVISNLSFFTSDRYLDEAIKIDNITLK